MKLIKCKNCDFEHVGEWGDKELYEHQKKEEIRFNDKWRGFEEDVRVNAISHQNKNDGKNINERR